MKTVKKIISLLLSVLFIITPLAGTVVFADAGAYISFSIGDFDYVTPETAIGVAFETYGDSIFTYETRLEGELLSTEASFEFTPAEKSLKNGVYTLVAEATDASGTSAIETLTFYVTDKIDIGFTYSEDESIVPSVSGATAETYYVDAFNYTVYYGTTSDGNISIADALSYSDYDAYALKYFNQPFEFSSVSGIPYQIFGIELNGKTEGNVVFRYTGSTYAAERIAIKVYNPSTSEWEKIATITGSDSVSEALDIATYSDNGTVYVAAILDYVTNGSDTMIWSTDPQHYTKFDDLNEYYYKIYQYAAEEYVKGNVGYILTTGDLVDDLPNTSLAIEQWKVADKAMSYVEEVGMPNGLVSGNHDVKTFKSPDYSAGEASVDYSKYLEYFNASRYNDKDWYGGSLNNNISHYDLVTIGNVDFIILFLGYGVEATDETIIWANDVLAKYVHRTAIIATHEYLDATAAKYSTQSRANLIFEKIVDPNPNVKVVLCGHDDGSLCLERVASDGRTVYEILSDYQFVEAEDKSFYENEHYIGSVPSCCGDGYIRLMTVNGSTLSSTTYSPVTGRYNPYGDRENISIDLGCDSSDRFISCTVFSAYTVGEKCNESIVDDDTAIIITDSNGNKIYHHVSYAEYPQMPEDTDDNASVDLAALEALIATAESVDTSLYTSETAEAFVGALQKAKNADKNSDSDVKSAYVELENSYGALTEKKEIIDPTSLDSQYVYDLTTDKWTTSDVAMTQLEPTGIYMERAENNTNGWASIKNSTAFDIKPVNGRIYMDLDISANSAWSVYIEASQANLSTPLRMNFAIDNAFHRTDADSYNGEYVGVYDVTEAFVAAGFDPTATITVNATYLFIVPGDVSYKYIEYLTDKTTEDADKTRLEKAISDAETIDKSLYTAGSYSQMETALSSAKNALNATVQADINLAALVLEQALCKLKLLADVVPEPEGSLVPADEGEWKQNAVGTMDIYRNEDNYTVIKNTNGEWPSTDYILPEAYKVTTADHMLSVDVTIGAEASFILNINGEWVYLAKHITTNLSSANDIKAGTYTVDIPLSNLVSDETASISIVRIFAVGPADSSAIIIRKLQIVDYVAPPKVEDELMDLVPESKDSITVVEGEGSVTVENGVITIVNNTENDFRTVFSVPELFDLDILNALHLDIESEIPFKMAYHIVGSDETSAWSNTSSEAYSSQFTVADDRVTAGKYDVYLEMRDNCGTITDKSSVYVNQFIIVVTGEGTFKLNTAEFVEKDTFDWPDNVTYGDPATPENLYYDHAAKVPPTVSEKFDLIPYFNMGDHPVISATVQTENGLNLDIDLNKTPYLYYSFIVPEDGDFTFSIYSNSTYSPWLTYYDSALSAEKPSLNNGAANWDANTSRQQYTKITQTGCIDMREYLKDPNVLKWVVNQLKFYRSASGTVTVSYFFFGSADATVPENPDDPIDPPVDPPVDPETKEFALGDINMDGTVNQYDYILAKRAHFNTITFNENQKLLGDMNEDGENNQYDYILVKRIHFKNYSTDKKVEIAVTESDK